MIRSLTIFVVIVLILAAAYYFLVHKKKATAPVNALPGPKPPAYAKPKPQQIQGWPLEVGHKGSSVRALQVELNRIVPQDKPLELTGVFDAEMRTRILTKLPAPLNKVPVTEGAYKTMLRTTPWKYGNEEIQGILRPVWIKPTILK